MNVSRKLKLIYLLIFCLALVFAGCSTDESRFREDAAAGGLIAKLAEELTVGRKPDVQDFAALKEILKKYPESETVRQTYKSALIRREDWNSLAAFLNEKPFDELSKEDRINLGKAYYKLGNYAEAAKALEADSDDRETRKILAASYFHTGNYSGSKAILDADWEKLKEQKASGEITLRGMIYFHENEPDKAIETLKTAIEMDPKNIPAGNTLSRIYAARGDEKAAKEYIERVQRTFDEITAEEKRRTQIVDKFYRLQEAFRANRFDEVISLGNELLPQADEKNKLALYQFLYNSHTALGQNAEARRALEEIKKLQPR